MRITYSLVSLSKDRLKITHTPFGFVLGDGNMQHLLLLQILLNEDRTLSKAEILGNPGLTHLSRFDASICNSDTDLVDNKGFCVRPSLCQQSSSCIIYTQAV